MQIDKEQRQALQQEFIQALHDANLVVMPRTVGQYAAAFYRKQKALLRAKSVSLCMIEKYNLIEGVKTRGTVKNMIKDHRIRPTEHLVVNGVQHVLTTAIKRLNNNE